MVLLVLQRLHDLLHCRRRAKHPTERSLPITSRLEVLRSNKAGEGLWRKGAIAGTRDRRSGLRYRDRRESGRPRPRSPCRLRRRARDGLCRADWWRHHGHRAVRAGDVCDRRTVGLVWGYGHAWRRRRVCNRLGRVHRYESISCRTGKSIRQ